jgi:hypothetical protein
MFLNHTWDSQTIGNPKNFGQVRTFTNLFNYANLQTYPPKLRLLWIVQLTLDHLKK